MNAPPIAWEELSEWTRSAALRLPVLPSFAEARSVDPRVLFRELGYTFWNQELLDTLSARLRGEGVARWVELAAGTGRWAAELARRGLPVVATDDYSQAPERVRSNQRPILYGEWVARMPAAEAVRHLHPEGVLCAWPPLGSGLIPDLLSGAMPGAEVARVIVCIGEPGGATEAPIAPTEISLPWRLETWPECERYLTGFNDPPAGPEGESNSRLWIYRRAPWGPHEGSV
ncbi:MAG TPA: hypothetical protein VK689_01300 [Armatimonadota bacterium]|nr:hypothetical protein [Armatimonadota bacterium]